MKEVVKYILIIYLGVLAFYHKSELTNFTMALYFGSEYVAMGVMTIYLATISKGIEKWLFVLVSGYLGLKLIYNTLLYIDPISEKLWLYNSEFWGYLLTVVIIVILIIIQFRYVLVKKR